MAFIDEKIKNKMEEIQRKLNSPDPDQEVVVRYHVTGHQLLMSIGVNESSILADLENVKDLPLSCSYKDDHRVLKLITFTGESTLLRFSNNQQILACRAVINEYLERRKKLSLFFELIKSNPLAEVDDTWAKVDKIWQSLQMRNSTELLR